MTDDSLQILRNISLVEVMRANGFEPERLPRSGRAVYLCPFHSDHDPSFSVEQRASEGHDAPGWGCMGCGKKGYGAIALQAALMGYDHTSLTAEQMQKVIQRLVDEQDVEVKDAAPTSPEERTKAIAPQECEFFTTDWTIYHLRALGFTVKNATKAGENGEQVVMYKEPDLGAKTAEHSEGDGKPVPLYRCSIDREYWRGRGEAKTAKEWGETIEREFQTYPCETFITAPVEAKQGGKCSLEIHARLTYPIFAMAYDWGTKKYEPRSRTTKWAWYKKDDVTARVYGDHVAVAAIASLVGRTAEHRTTAGEAGAGKPWFADALKDRRHPVVVTQQDADKNPVKAKMKRLVLCSGPRDGMQMWAATDAHVLWLNSESAGIKDGVVEEWLRVLLMRMSQVAVDIYVCYDIDATGLACSGSIALENARVHWVRLPKEMNEVGGRPDGKPSGTVADNGRKTTDGEQGATENNSTEAYHSGTTPAPASVTKTAKRKGYKDVTDFVTHFSQIQRLFAPDLRKANSSEALMRMLKNALTMQFWIDKHTTKKTEKEGEKEHNVRYVLSVANLLQFLDAKGIRCHQDERGNRAFYQLSHRNTYRYLDTSRTGNQLESVCRTAMLDWIDAHFGNDVDYADTDDKPRGDDPSMFKANLVNTIFTGKGLDARTMNTMPSAPINEHSWGEDFDHFFFENCAVRVTKDEICEVPYAQLPWVTNEEAIMPGEFHVKKQPWRIVVNPKYEAERKRHEEIWKKCSTPSMRAAENLRWKQYEDLWKYRLVMDKPFEEMPMHFQFVYNTCRIFWEKESFGETLTAIERQMQDMHFINKVHCVGYSITRFRSLARQLTVHMTDYSVTDENKASGRNGKSTFIDMMATVRPSSANIAGKSMKNITMEVLFGYVVAHLHTLVCMDEMPDNFNVEDLYNIGIRIVCKTLYKQPVTLVGEEVPKVFITSNKPFDRSAGSTKGRIYPCFTSDYYHAATDDGRWLDHAPKDDFLEKYGVAEVARNLPPQLLNELQNMLLAMAQFYLQHPNETILPPTESRSLRRELYAMTKDSGLTDWLITYFEDTPDNPHIGQPIPPQEMAISLLDAEGEGVTWDTIEKAKKRIAKYLKPCLNRMGIVMDPDVVLNTSSYRRRGGRQTRAWLTVLDQQGKPVERMEKNKYRHEVSTGERVPRELSAQHTFVHYFYRNRPGGVPTKPYTAGKEYEEGYVQAAAEKDPEEGGEQ